MKKLLILLLLIPSLSWGASAYEPNKGECISGDCENGYGTQTYIGNHRYPDGSKYVGDFKNNLRHGRGTYTFKEGEVYFGELQYGYAHGQGTTKYHDGGGKHVGGYKYGFRSGLGSTTNSDGSIVTGIYASIDNGVQIDTSQPHEWISAAEVKDKKNKKNNSSNTNSLSTNNVASEEDRIAEEERIAEQKRIREEKIAEQKRIAKENPCNRLSSEKSFLNSVFTDGSSAKESCERVRKYSDTKLCMKLQKEEEKEFIKTMVRSYKEEARRRGITCIDGTAYDNSDSNTGNMLSQKKLEKKMEKKMECTALRTEWKTLCKTGDYRMVNGAYCSQRWIDSLYC